MNSGEANSVGTRGGARGRGRRGAGAWRSAFTLIELLVSASIVGVLAVAMGSGLWLISKAVASGSSAGVETVSAAEVMERIRADVRLATSFSERTATAATFTIPDRDGDGEPETVRYAWSGVKGTPLTRAYNATAPEVMAEDVRRFDLSYLIGTIRPRTPPEPQEGAEVLLLAHENAPGGTFRSFAVDWDSYCAQYVKPTLPSDAVSWRITRVQVMARNERKPFNGVLNVVVTPANSSLKPVLPVLDESQVAEASLTDLATWVNVPFSKLEGLDPSQGYCVVVAYRGGTGVIGNVQYEEGGNPMTPNAHWMTTNNLGFSYTSPDNVRDMCIRVYGTVTTGGAP